MRYRIMMSVEVDEANDTQAYKTALKLETLLRQPLVQMALSGEGIRVAGDGALTVHRPIPLPYK